MKKKTAKDKEETSVKNIGKDAILKIFKLYRALDPLDYFYVTIIGVRDEDYLVIVDSRERTFLVSPKYLHILN